MKNFFIILITLLGLTTYAQIRKGIVVDSDGNPVENAYINNISSDSHAHTNEFGMFSIDKTVTGNILKVNALGFKKISYVVSESELRIRG